jgi:hypothetical protein
MEVHGYAALEFRCSRFRDLLSLQGVLNFSPLSKSFLDDYLGILYHSTLFFPFMDMCRNLGRGYLSEGINYKPPKPPPHGGSSHLQLPIRTCT